MKKLSFLKKLINVVADKKERGSKISAQDAASVQQNYIENKIENFDTCTPPYLQIAKQLDVKKPEIFRAAVHYLVLIAQNQPKYYNDIVQIIQKYNKKSRISAENKFYLANALDALLKRKS